MSGGTMFLRACGAGHELVAMVPAKPELDPAAEAAKAVHKANRTVDRLRAADARWISGLHATPVGMVDMKSVARARRHAAKYRRHVTIRSSHLARLAGAR